jgi:hypothetical protein
MAVSNGSKQREARLLGIPDADGSRVGERDVERLAPRPQRRRAAGFPAATPRDAHAAFARVVPDLRRQRGLADAGLAREEVEPTAARRHGRDRIAQLRELSITSDQRTSSYAAAGAE